MYFHMLVEIRSLSEAESAPVHRALVRSLVSVDAKVVEEVVPLPEVLAAVVMIALKNLNVSFRLGVLEREDPEFLG